MSMRMGHFRRPCKLFGCWWLVVDIPEGYVRLGKGIKLGFKLGMDKDKFYLFFVAVPGVVSVPSLNDFLVTSIDELTHA